MAKTKAGGSTRNGRDSKGRRLGLKLGAGQFAKAGAIILRQRGTKIFAGDNVGRGNDDTLFALEEGYVNFKMRHNRKFVFLTKERE